MKPLRLAIVETHPIQYKAPWFRRLAAEPDLDVEVLFAMVPEADQQGADFGVAFTWDVPLLDGYRWRRLRNVAARPSVTRFAGCDTPELYAAVRRERWDAVLVNGWVVKSCLQALLAARLARVPCMVRGESNAMRRRPGIKRIGHRLLLSQYGAFLAIGESNRAFYLQHGVPARKIFRAPYGVDNRRFREGALTARASGQDSRRRWGLQPESCVFLFCGKLIPKKHPLDFLRGLEPCIAAMPPGIRVEGLIVGDGELRAACSDYAAQHRLPVVFAGFLNQSELPAAYAACDALVLPSDEGETWGLVVNEAMASGLPAIVSDRVGCGPDLIRPGETGEVYPLGRTEELALKMRSLAGDPARRLRMGRRAMDHVGRFDADAAAAGTMEALEFVTAAHRGSRG